MKTGTDYSKVKELSLGDIGVICNINKPKYTNNVKRIIRKYIKGEKLYER